MALARGLLRALCAACVFPANVEQTVLSLRRFPHGHGAPQWAPAQGERSALMASTVCRQTAGRKGARVFLGLRVAKQSIQPMAQAEKKGPFLFFLGWVGV